MKIFYKILFPCLVLLTSFNLKAQSSVYFSEAEDGDLTNAGVSVIASGCGNKSGDGLIFMEGADAGEEGREVKFTGIDISDAGVYDLEITYFASVIPKLEIIVNGGSPVVEDGFTNPGFCFETSPESISIPIQLVSGVNEVILSPVAGINSPFLDKIEIFSRPSGINVTAINLASEGDVSEVALDGTLQLMEEVLPENATDPTVTWSIGEGTGAGNIDQQGLFTATSEGTVNVIATANDGSGVAGTFQITVVNDLPVETITVIANETNELENFSFLQLEAQISPANASYQSVSWSVVNESGVATITNSGILVAHQEGTILVVATASDGSEVSGQKQITIAPSTKANIVYFVEGEFGVLNDQAEVTATGCNGASGQGVVSLSNSGSEVAFNQIYAPEAGTYDMVLDYFSGTANPVKAHVFVNDESKTNPIVLNFDNIGFCSDAQSAQLTFEIVLDAGLNNISFANTELESTVEPLIDALSIINQPVPIASILLAIESGTTLTNFEYAQIIATIEPEDVTDKSVSWSISSGSELARITDGGILVPYEEGLVTVIATANDGSQVTGEIQLTIESNAEEGLVYKTEAEFGQIGNGAELAAANCENASGVGVVSFTSVTSDLIFDNIVAPVVGLYELNLEYFSGTEKEIKLDLFINDETFDNPISLDFENIGFCSAGAGSNRSFQVELQGGNNTLHFKRSSDDTTIGSLIDVLYVYENPVSVTQINVSSEGDQTTISAGETLQMNVEVLPANASNNSVSWSVINETGVATISSTGLVTANKAGTVLIQASANDGSEVVGSFHLTIQGSVQPNIIVILVDDAGYADFGFTGSAVTETPNIDQLRSEGTMFSQAYVTESVCAPSRAALLTGRYQQRYGFEYNIVDYKPAPGYTNADVGLDPNESTLADHLKSLGYSTSAIGKWHLGEESKHHPNNRGFDYFYGLLGGSRPYLHTADLPEDKQLERNGSIDDLTDGYMTDVLTDDVISWMKQEVENDKPFFAYLSYTAVHGPYESKAEDFDRYTGNCESFGGECSEDRQNYIAMIYNLDQNIGKLVDSLKAHGAYDNTLFYFINDNGGPNENIITDNSPHRGGKSSIYEGGLRVPFFIKWKGFVPAGATYDQPVISMDIAASSIVAAGGELPTNNPLDGVDLVLLANNPTEPAHDKLFFRRLWRWGVVIDNDQKLILDFSDPTINEIDTVLYNVNDESTDLYESGNADAQDMLAAYANWEKGLSKPYWIGKYTRDRLCDDTSNNFANCPTVWNYYNTTGGEQFEFEAEDGELVGPTTEIVTSCSNASEGAFVKLTNNTDNYLRFSDIQISQAGEYLLTFDYYTAFNNELNVIVNEDTLVTSFPAAYYCFEGNAVKHSVIVDFPVGASVLTLSSTGATAAPLLDRLEINPFEPYELGFKTNHFRMAVGDSTEIVMEVDKPLPEDQSFELEVIGLDASNYEVSSTFLIISAGGTSTSTVIKSTGAAGNGTLRLKNASARLILKDKALANIEILSESQTFYISSSEGDDANDGLTDVSAVQSLDRLNQIQLIPGDSILFKSGDSFIGQLRVSGSGTDHHPIIITSYGEGDLPVLDGASAEGGAYTSAILIENKEYLELSNLTITNDRKESRDGESDEVGYGIYIHNSGNKTLNHFRLKNLTVEEVFAVSTEGVEDFDDLQVAGIYLRTEANEEGQEKQINDVIIEDCYITRTGKFGIWSQHAGGSDGGSDSLSRNRNFIIRNNHIFETGGSGVTPGRTYNCLVEDNTFEYTGSDVDPRMAARGSGAWFFNCRNVIAQHNKSYHVRGKQDSYGMHIDFGNKYVILQYNYSEDSEGGFVEVLGKNENVGYRYNISVNDGLRSTANSFWLSTHAAPERVASDSVFIYNNTIYVGRSLDTDIKMEAGNVYFYNNIVAVANGAEVGEVFNLTEDGGVLSLDNNLFYGNVNGNFVAKDANALFADPLFSTPGALGYDNYQLCEGSPALQGSNNSLPEIPFPMAGKGIFKEITANATSDYFGNPVDLSQSPHLGAFNGAPVQPYNYPKVEISVSKTQLSPGDILVIDVVADKPVLEDEQIDIQVSDDLMNLLNIPSSIVSISRESSSSTISYTVPEDNENSADVEGKVGLTNPTSGIKLGDAFERNVTILQAITLLDRDEPIVGVSLYPNPVDHYFKIEGNISIQEVDLICPSGKVVKLTVSENGMYNVGSFASGVYLLRMRMDEGKVSVAKFIKE